MTYLTGVQTGNAWASIDEQDNVFFQDNRIWFAYGGTGSAVGDSSACPADLKGKAFIDNQAFDISSFKTCKSGKNCAPVQLAAPKSGFTMPTGCVSVSYPQLNYGTQRALS